MALCMRFDIRTDKVQNFCMVCRLKREAAFRCVSAFFLVTCSLSGFVADILPCRHSLFNLGDCAQWVRFSRYINQELRNCVISTNWLLVSATPSGFRHSRIATCSVEVIRGAVRKRLCAATHVRRGHIIRSQYFQAKLANHRRRSAGACGPERRAGRQRQGTLHEPERSRTKDVVC